MAHVFLAYQIAIKWDMGVSGLGIATAITYTLMFVFVTVYSHCNRAISPALFWPRKDTFSSWGSYLAISVPATLMLMANSCVIQVMGVLAGLISIRD